MHSTVDPTTSGASTDGPLHAKYSGLRHRMTRLLKDNVALSNRLEKATRRVDRETKRKRALADRVHSLREKERPTAQPMTIDPSTEDDLPPHGPSPIDPSDVEGDVEAPELSDPWDSDDPLPMPYERASLPPPVSQAHSTAHGHGEAAKDEPIEEDVPIPGEQAPSLNGNIIEYGDLPQEEANPREMENAPEEAPAKEANEAQEETPTCFHASHVRAPFSFIPIDQHQPPIVLPPPPNNWSLHPPPAPIMRADGFGRVPPPEDEMIPDVDFTPRPRDDTPANPFNPPASASDKARPSPASQAHAQARAQALALPVDGAKGGTGGSTPASTPASTIPVNVFPTAKPRKMNKIITQTRRVTRIRLDATGRPILPLKVGILSVLAIGDIVYDRPDFHNERYIWPVGYKVSRPFASLVDKDKDTTVVCSILDGGNGPRFMLEFDDLPNHPIIAQTATGAWTAAVRRANELRNRDHSNSASGPDYFGFSNSLIAKIIQDLPNADHCVNYHMQTFEEAPLSKKEKRAIEDARVRRLQSQRKGKKSGFPERMLLDEDSDDLEVDGGAEESWRW